MTHEIKLVSPVDEFVVTPVLLVSRSRSKKAPRHSPFAVGPKGPRLKSSGVILYACLERRLRQLLYTRKSNCLGVEVKKKRTHVTTKRQRNIYSRGARIHVVSWKNPSISLCKIVPC
jgi:hypothetical protein